ncbi:DUF3304 domain-containing protein [Paraburkholderia phenoliruptrix]|uniref:DUF3304 domain-containing protein n=1 Tax=Paraburkholderia phenoliruptrix TaxID=252970 RepID=UPI0034CD2F35
MQDWVTDDPMHFLRSMKTATQLHAEAFMTCTTCEQQPWFSFFFDGTGNQAVRRMARIFVAMMSSMLAACATGQRMDYVDASAWSANYTEDYIQDFWIQTADGKTTGVGGVSVSEFSRGGTSGRICCSLMPGVGQTIKVVWRVGGHQEDESTWKAYSRDVEVKGAMPTQPQSHSYLIVRFFPDHEVEAELFPSANLRPENPRVDKLFSGRRVTRHIGE